MGMTRHLWLTTYQTLYLLSYSTTAKCMAFKPKWQNAESIEKDAWYIPVSFRPFFLYLRQVETHRNVALVVLWVSTKPEWEGRQDDIKGKSKDKDRRDPLFLEKKQDPQAQSVSVCVSGSTGNMDGQRLRVTWAECASILSSSYSTHTLKPVWIALKRLIWWHFKICRHVKPLPNGQLEVLAGCIFISIEPHFTQ